MKNISLSLLILLSILLISGCSPKDNEKTPESKKITADQAKAMMDKDPNIVILDVRTQDEFNEGRIQGAILIPDNEIKDKAESTLVDKNATILVYCRSGRRSALAAADLVSLGYTNVYDFGGIIDWTYEVVK